MCDHWREEGARVDSININNGSVLMCGLLIDMVVRSDCTASVVAIAKNAGKVVDGLTFSKFAAFGWMG